MAYKSLWACLTCFPLKPIRSDGWFTRWCKMTLIIRHINQLSAQNLHNCQTTKFKYRFRVIFYLFTHSTGCLVIYSSSFVNVSIPLISSTIGAQKLPMRKHNSQARYRRLCFMVLHSNVRTKICRSSCKEWKRKAWEGCSNPAYFPTSTHLTNHYVKWACLLVCLFQKVTQIIGHRCWKGVFLDYVRHQHTEAFVLL